MWRHVIMWPVNATAVISPHTSPFSGWYMVGLFKINVFPLGLIPIPNFRNFSLNNQIIFWVCRWHVHRKRSYSESVWQCQSGYETPLSQLIFLLELLQRFYLAFAAVGDARPSLLLFYPLVYQVWCLYMPFLHVILFHYWACEGQQVLSTNCKVEEPNKRCEATRKWKKKNVFIFLDEMCFLLVKIQNNVSGHLRVDACTTSRVRLCWSTHKQEDFRCRRAWA